MNWFDKKFHEMLESSTEHLALKMRVRVLESHVTALTKALGDASRAYVELAKVTVGNQKAIEGVYACVESLMDVDQPDPAPEMTDEELIEHKRNLN